MKLQNFQEFFYLKKDEIFMTRNYGENTIYIKTIKKFKKHKFNF